jgi:preprotein translocase subunit SecD
MTPRRSIALLACITLVACKEAKVHRPAGAPRSTLAFCIANESPAFPGQTPVVVPTNKMTLYLAPAAVVTNADIRAVELAENQYGSTVIDITISPEAARRMHDVTSESIGKHMAILIDGKVVMTPRITSVIDDRVRIEAGYTHAQAAAIAERLAPE